MKNRRNAKFLIMDAVLVLMLLVLLFYGQQKGLWGIRGGGMVRQASSAAVSSAAAPSSALREQTAVSSQPPAPADADYVKVTNYIPGIYVDLKYATNENITGHAIYDFVDAYLRYGTVKKLEQVQDELNASGYSLKIWDAYRPLKAQAELWNAEPDPRYISRPSKPTSHNLGNTVDVTIVKKNGPEIPVPSGFDNFTKKADRDYSDVTEEQKNNALLLQNTMVKYGFNTYSAEWWHFEDTQDYPYVDFEP